LQQAIAELSGEQRSRLSEIVELLLGITLQIKSTVPNNSMSQKYISCSGHNLSYTSSGFRLITTLVTSLLDVDYDTFLIDEPELGISPEAQGVIADFLFDRKHRAKYFPHVKTLIFATHSSIFLDRLKIGNNYRVEKKGDEINMTRIETQQDFNRVHFFLLGNRFETLYLPTAILLVEGKTDHKFIERALQLKFPSSQFSVVPAHSDSRIKEILAVAKGLFADIQKSPYRDRIFVILASVAVRKLLSAGAAIGKVFPDTKEPIIYHVHSDFYKMLARLRSEDPHYRVNTPSAELTNGLKAAPGGTVITPSPTAADIGAALDDVASGASEFVILAHVDGHDDYIQIACGPGPFCVECRIWLNDDCYEYFQVLDPKDPHGGYFIAIDDVKVIMLHWLRTGRLPSHVKTRNMTKELDN
jgi:hypothetical protein